MKILVSAFIGVANLGDVAITQVIANWLAGDKRINGVTLLSSNPAQTAKIVPTDIGVVKSGIKNLVTQLKRSDCLVLGGGGIINDESSVASLASYYMRVFIAKRIMHKPVFLLFVGVGPIKTRIGARFLKSMRKLVTHSLVRDEESANLLEKHGFARKDITVAYDAVFNYFIQPIDERKADVPSPYILFCPRDWFFRNSVLPTKLALRRARKHTNSNLYVFRRSLLRTVEQVLSKNKDLTVLAVPFYLSQDTELLHWMESNLQDEYAGRFIVQTGELSPNEYVRLARQSRVVVGVRLHALILGALARRPLVALSYSSKVQNLARYLGLGEYVTALDSPKFNVTATVQNILHAAKEHVPYEKQLDIFITENNKAIGKVLKIMARE